jgi:hypothetical protein
LPVAILTELSQLSKNDDIHGMPKLFIDLTHFVHWPCAQRLLPVFYVIFHEMSDGIKILSRAVAPECYPFHEIVIKKSV